MAPSTPVELAEAGAQFAFSSGGAESPDEFLAGVRRAVEGGLEPGRALTALTRDAAATYGLEDRIGTVAEGLAADLVLADGYPWQESVRVAAVFVDGRRYAASDGDDGDDAGTAEGAEGEEGDDASKTEGSEETAEAEEAAPDGPPGGAGGRGRGGAGGPKDAPAAAAGRGRGKVRGRRRRFPGADDRGPTGRTTCWRSSAGRS